MKPSVEAGKPAGERAFGVRDVAKVAWKSAGTDLVCALAAVVVSSGSNILFPKIVGWMVDLVAAGEGEREGARCTSKQGAMLSLGIFAAGAVGSIARVYFLEISAMKISVELRQSMFGAVLGNEKLALDRTSVVTSLSKDTEDLAKSICKNAASLYRGCNSAFGGTAMLLWISPQLTIVSLSLLPLLGTGAMTYSKFSRRQARSYKAETEAAISRAGERVEHIDTVRLFGNEQREVEAFSASMAGLRSSARRAALAEGVFMGGLSFSISSSLLAVVIYGGSLVRTGGLSAGQLASFGLYSGFVGLGFSQLSSSYADFQRVLGASQRVRALCAAGSAPVEPERPAVAPAAGPVTVRVEGVAFEYTPEVPVLRDVSLALEPGVVNALAGRSGQGKTTLTRILCRFLEPRRGRVTWNGVDVASMDRREYRTMLSVVDQRPALFRGLSLADNIAYSRPGASRAELERAAELAGLADLLARLPRGLDTVLGSSEQDALSVGQAQRVALARAFLRRDTAALFIFDEATSAQDGLSEKAIMAALRILADQRKTVLLVAHRASTLALADRVIELEDGVIVGPLPPAALAEQQQEDDEEEEEVA